MLHVRTITIVLMLLSPAAIRGEEKTASIPPFLKVGETYDFMFFLQGQQLVEILDIEHKTGWVLIKTERKDLDGFWINILSVASIKPSQESVDSVKAVKREKKAGQALKSILMMYQLRTGRYPTTAEGLQALLEEPANVKNWKGPYVKSLPTDRWGHDFKYESDGKGYVITSLGADGQEGGTGDDEDSVVAEKTK